VPTGSAGQDEPAVPIGIVTVDAASVTQADRREQAPFGRAAKLPAALLLALTVCPIPLRARA